MYSLWSNYTYIHRELWRYSKKPVLFQALEIVSQVLTGFFGILLPAGILYFLEASSGFAEFTGLRLERWFSFSAMPSFSSAMRFCSHGMPGSTPSSGPAFSCAVCSAISCGWITPF